MVSIRNLQNGWGTRKFFMESESVFRKKMASYTIKTLYEDGPAYKAGLQVRDALVESTENPLNPWNFPLFNDDCGEKGTSVKIKVRRLKQELVFEIPRGEIVVKLIERQDLKIKNLALTYLKIRDFENTNTCRKMREALEDIQKIGKSKALILDLRNNPGGLVSEATCMLPLPRRRWSRHDVSKSKN